MRVFGVFVLVWLVMHRISWAQVREDAEVLLAPALEVFAGNGTGGEIFWVGVAVVGGGLVFALLAANIMWGLQKITYSILVKVFGLWLIVSLSLSAVGTSWYMSQVRIGTLIKADVGVQPLDVRVQRVGNSLVVRWRTTDPTYGHVKFRTNLRTQIGVRLSATEKMYEHEVAIELREGETDMWLSVLSNGVEYREGGDELWVGLLEK